MLNQQLSCYRLHPAVAVAEAWLRMLPLEAASQEINAINKEIIDRRMLG